MQNLLSYSNSFLIISIIVSLAACGGGGGSSSDSTVTISGKITSVANTGGEAGVLVKGFYSESDTTSTTTEAGGNYSLTVTKDKTLSLQFSKAGFATLNSEKTSLSTDEIGFDIDMVTTEDVQIMIDMAVGAPTPLASKGWLVVEVTDAMIGNDVSHTIISSTPAETAEFYTDCAGNDSGMDFTAFVTPPCNREVMYLAYFDAAVETSVSGVQIPDQPLITVGPSIAPIRIGEITIVGFEVSF